MARAFHEHVVHSAATPSLVSYTHVIYGLHAFGVLVGVTTAAGVLTSFLFGIPSLIGVIMNYARRRQVQATWLESHFIWQIRTFWIAAALGAVSFLISAPLMLVLIGFLLWWALVTAIGIWVLYRVARGWLRLKDGEEMYA